MNTGAAILSLSLVTCALACSSCARVQASSRHIAEPAVSAVMQRQVRNAIDAGDGDFELRRLRQRLAQDANDLDARILLARHYSRLGAPDLALEHYRLAAERFPDSVIVALELAKTFRELGRPEQSLKSVSEWLGRHPAGNWELLSLEGILEDEQGQFHAAEAAYRSAITLEEGRSALHNNLGYNLFLQGRATEAEAEFRRALEIDPTFVIARNNLGAALVSESGGAPAAALAEWRQSADAAVAHNNLAVTFMEQGRYSEARTELEAALKLRGNFAAALANLRLVAAKDGKSVTLPLESKRAGGKRPTSRSKMNSTLAAASNPQNVSATAPVEWTSDNAGAGRK